MIQYRRLTGSTFGLKETRLPIEMAVDEACGHKPDPIQEEEAYKFIEFVRENVWGRLPQSVDRSAFSG